MTDTPNASGEPDELYLDAAATEPVTRNVIEAMIFHQQRDEPYH